MKKNRSLKFDMDSTKILEVIEEIDESISKSETTRDKSNVGLFTGESGIGLFYAYLYLYSGDDQYLKKTLSILDNVYETMNRNESPILNFGSGLCGVGWFVQHLEFLGLVDSKESAAFYKIDDSFSKMMLHYADLGYLDYISGALGYPLFFIKNLKRKSRILSLEKLVRSLDKNKINTGDSYAWADFDLQHGKVSESVINLGLSHGMPSTLSVLLKLYRNNILVNLSSDLLIGGTKFLLKVGDFESVQKKSYFDHHHKLLSEDSSIKKQSRLAWCYGDLGILNLLININNTFNIKELKEVIDDMILFECSRTELKANDVLDAGLCHGSAGIFLILDGIKKKYRPNSAEIQSRLAEATAFWLTTTIKDLRDKNGGYLRYNPFTKTYERDFGLIEGMAGVGLMLVSTLSQNTAWNEVILLD